MEYSMFPGGKRIRPLVLVGSCIGVGGNQSRALPYAAALEMIHAYALIHDDLPAMDNSDTRRGKPSVHKKFNEATAILAGDGLLNLAYEVMLAECVNDPCYETACAAYIIADASGVAGMIGGQSADLFYEKKNASDEALMFIHVNKTSALFSVAGYAGSILGGASDIEAAIYTEAWRSLGIAFQIKDDIENATGDATVLGKPVGNDAESKKNTYVSVFGLDKARADMKKYSSLGIGSIGKNCGLDSFIYRLACMIFE